MLKHNNQKTGKYPISVNGHQCIGPCYQKGTKIIHPLTLEQIVVDEYNYCPTNTYVNIGSDGSRTTLENDMCHIPTSKTLQIDDNIVVPEITFSSEYFIKVYYKIDNIEGLLNWLDKNTHNPYKTKERVFDNAMCVYGNDLVIIDQRIVTYIDKAMYENLPKIYNSLKKYFVIRKDVIELQEPSNSNDNTIKDIREVSAIRNYIKDNFLGSSNIHQFMSKFIRYYKEDLTKKHLTSVLVGHMIDYINKKILVTLEQT
jgi:hypothetical protein